MVASVCIKSLIPLMQIECHGTKPREKNPKNKMNHRINEEESEHTQLNWHKDMVDGIIQFWDSPNVRKYHLVPTEVKKNNVFFFFLVNRMCSFIKKKEEEQCVRLKAKGPKRTDCTHASVISAHNKQRWPNKISILN